MFPLSGQEAHENTGGKSRRPLLGEPLSRRRPMPGVAATAGSQAHLRVGWEALAGRAGQLGPELHFPKISHDQTIQKILRSLAK